MTYDIESIVIKVLANDSGNLIIPLKGYSTSGSTNCPYSWNVSVDEGAETTYSGTGGGTLTIATGLVAGSEHLVIIKPTTVDYQWARAFGTGEDEDVGKYIVEVVQDLSYVGYGVSATNTGDRFRLSQYACSYVRRVADEGDIPDTVTTIGIDFMCAQFYACKYLIEAPKEGKMGTGVVSIGADYRSWMYQDCDSLTNGAIEQSLPNVNTIGNSYREGQYYNCPELTVAYDECLGDNVTTIGQKFRQGQYFKCVKLTSAAKEALSNSLLSIGHYFRYYQYDEDTLLVNPAEEVMPDSVTTIGNYFRFLQYAATGITKTVQEVMPKSLVSIGTYGRYNQYYNCLSLKEIVGECRLGSNVSIGTGYRAAQYPNCALLSKAKLAAQNGLSNYRNGCFNNDNSLKTIIIIGDVLDTPLNAGQINNNSVEKIYVDSSLVSAYQNSSNWSTIDDSKFFAIPSTTAQISPILFKADVANSDNLDLVTGKLRTVHKAIILNGTENWTWDSTNHVASLTVSGLKDEDLVRGFLCSHGDIGTDVDRRFQSGGKINCHTSMATLQDFKDWLVQEYTDNTPVICIALNAYYATSTITVDDINTQNGENIIEITQGGPDVNKLQAQITVEQSTGGYTANMFNGEDYSVEANWTEISEQDAGLTAGENITIENNIISAKDTTYTAGDNVNIDNNKISVDLDGYQTIDNMVQDLDDADHSHYPTAKAVKDAIVSGGLGDVSGPSSSVDGNVVLFDGTTGKTIKDSGVSLSNKQDTLTAGNGIDIDANNKISTTFVYGESTTAAATVQKEVSIPSITELNVGQVIIVKPTITSTVANSTLKLNDFDAYSMLYNGSAITTSTDSIVWSANVPSMFYLDEVSGTKYWRFLGHGLDSNSTYTINYLYDAGRYQAGTGAYAITRYSLVMMKPDGTWEKITATNANYSTGTTKTVNTNGFVLNQIKYYNTTTVLANGALAATSSFSAQAAAVNGSYSFNCGTAPGWAVGTPIYLVGSMGADGLFYLDTTKWWDTQLPSTKDGKLYIRLGMALDATNSTFSFLQDRPIFYYDNGIRTYLAADNKQDVISDLATIRSGAELGATAIQPNDNISELTNDAGYITSAPVTSVNNQTGDVVLTIPTTASDVGALPNTTKYGAALTLEVNSSTYVVTATLKDQDGNTLGTAQTIDLPLESVVVSGSYDDTTKKIILTLQSGSTVEFSVADLVSGLQSEITSTNKLSSDLVDDTNHTNKFVTAAEKTKLSNLSGTNTGDETGTTIKTKLGAASASADGYLTSTDWSAFNSKQDAISDLATIRSGAGAGATALQPGDNISDLSNDAGYLTSSTGVTSFNGNTGAITYTAPVTSVNGQTGAVTVSVTTYGAGTGINIDANNNIQNTGVTSFNGSTGVVTYTAPVTSVNGQTGAVTVTDTTYTAGTGIEIKNGPDYSAMQGPAPTGYHIPSNTERQTIVTELANLGWNNTVGETLEEALLMPFAGYRYGSSSSVYSAGSRGFYWSSTAYSAGYAYRLSFDSSSLNPQDGNYRSVGFSVRCFKDFPTIPTDSWTVIDDGSEAVTPAEGAGIYHNPTLGVISISSDGVNWITIMDKNLGATTVFNYGDTVTDANCGYFYQWGNNYGFPHSGTVTTSSTQVDASGYGPGNYYNSSTFITSNADWSSVQNDNLWGGATGVVTLNNAITNTGVTSFNGNTGAVTYTAPVTSVNGQTGAVTVSVTTYSAGTGINIDANNQISNTGVTSVNGNTGAVTINGIIRQSSAPSSPRDGELWYNTYEMIYYVYSEDFGKRYPLSYSYTDYAPGAVSNTITLDPTLYNYVITVTGDGTTITNVVFNDASITAVTYKFELVNSSSSYSAIINLLGTQIVVQPSQTEYVDIVYNDLYGTYRAAAGTQNLVTRNEYDSLGSGKTSDGVMRWIVE